LSNAGRLTTQKGQKYLIELAYMLKIRDIPFSMKMAGKGPLGKYLKELAAEKRVTDCIEFTGFIADMKSFIEETDIFVFPSLHEGISNVLLEMMEHGKPVIAFDISSMPEVIQHQQNGILVKIGDTDALCKETIRLIQDQPFRNRLAMNARKTIHEHFSEETFLHQLLPLI
jgi:glycosyltransferase involved in cell wall biosynthesis